MQIIEKNVVFELGDQTQGHTRVAARPHTSTRLHAYQRRRNTMWKLVTILHVSSIEIR